MRFPRLALVVLGGVLIYAIALWLPVDPPATAQVIIATSTCANQTQITSAAPGYSYCFDQTSGILQGWNGSGWVSMTPTISAASHVVLNVRDYGALGDGTTDDAAAFQAAITAAQTTGAAVYVPVPPTRYLIATTMLVNTSSASFPLTLYGDGRYASTIRFTGTGAWLGPTNTSNIQVTIRSLGVQMTGASATGINATQFINSVFEDLYLGWAGSDVDATGINVNIANIAYTPFYNVVSHVVFDGLAAGVTTQSSVAQHANRWRITDSTFTSGHDGIILSDAVAGMTITAPVFSELTGAGITLGPTDRTLIVAPDFESSVSGSLFAISPAANRTVILGLVVHAGALGTNELGMNPTLIGGEDLNTVASVLSVNLTPILVATDSGANVQNIIGLAGATSTKTNNFVGTCTFSASASCDVGFPNNEVDSHYKVLVGCIANVTSRAKSGFTLVATETNSNACDWMIVR